MTREKSKHAKYNSGNPISNLLINRFFNCVSDFYKGLVDIESVIDVGCGEGFLLEHLHRISPSTTCCALDINPIEVIDAAKRLPFCDTSVGNLYDLSFQDNSFDLVICCEVLEHLENPARAIDELRRICKRYAILSVPKEPLWRLMNIARLKYLNAFGNPPEHLQHWNRTAFLKFISPHFEVIGVKSPSPWTIVLCKKTST